MQISKDIIHREIAGEHILIPNGELALRCNGLYAITELGAEIWEYLKEGKSVSDIKAVLLETYDVEEDVLSADVDEFLQMLRKNNLIWD